MFRLYWLRENGCDAGTLLRAEELEPRIRQRVVEVAPHESQEIVLRLPFFDNREWRSRDKILSKLTFQCSGGAITCALPLQGAIRDRAATLALTDPAWISAPNELHPEYFATWQSVSVALQRFLRRAIAGEYFHDMARYQDRDRAFTMLVYQAARVNRGRPSTEFTYDLRDYPENQETLASGWRGVGNTVKQSLAAIERQLSEAGMPALALRYAPVWYEDVICLVRRRPRDFFELLANESALINALIDLGAQRTVAAINNFAKVAHQSLRKVYGMDLRGLAIECLEETTRVLRGVREDDG